MYATAALLVPLEAGVNFTGIKGIMLLVAGLVIMFAGIGIAHMGRKGNFKKAAESGGGVLLGATIVVIGASFAFFSGALDSAVKFFFQS